jgi:hypothetical protein
MVEKKILDQKYNGIIQRSIATTSIPIITVPKRLFFFQATKMAGIAAHK